MLGYSGSIITYMRDRYWLAYDRLKSLEIICQSPEGKKIYRQGQLLWKTKALILSDHASEHRRSIRAPAQNGVQ